MVIHKFNSFRRYTPPTCTLEIYHPQPFWGRWRSQHFPPLFSFQLHFDDPRLTQEDKITVIGDRDLLETLRKTLTKYVQEYLNCTSIWEQPEKLACEIPLSAEGKIVHLSRLSAYSHLLYYQSFEPHPETIEVVLNNTQLVDFVNALDTYHWDATNVNIKKKKRSLSASAWIALIAIITTAGGLGWWRYQQNLASDIAQETDDENLPADKYDTNVQAVVPPQPLDAKNIPQTIVPKIPAQTNLAKISPQAIRQQSLLPPPNITPSSIDLVIPNEDNNSSKQNNLSITSVLPTPSSKTTSSSSKTKPFPSQKVFNLPSNSTDKKVNPSVIMAIKPSFNSPPTIKQDQVIENKQPPSKPLNTKTNPPSTVPVLSAANPKPSLDSSNNLPNLPTTNNQQIKPSVKLRQQLSTDNSPIVIAKQISNNVSTEVETYFQSKWQPPENLTQSIEYRLVLNGDGSLSRITPVGQIASIFIDQTPMPLIGEIITSGFTQVSPLTIRLILSPSGNVETFAE